jgi:hypothetical protein
MLSGTMAEVRARKSCEVEAPTASSDATHTPVLPVGRSRRRNSPGQLGRASDVCPLPGHYSEGGLGT